MTYTTALAAPPRFQWEASSGTFNASQSNNCGPTCMAFIAGFYRDRSYGIEAVRRLIVPCCAPVDITDQRDMLFRVGVPAEVYNISSLSALKAILSSGRRPIGMRLYMARVPYVYRGHPFTGWHEVVAIANGTRDGVSGVWIMDPNFSPPGGTRPDPMHGHRFYPDWLVKSAFIDHPPAYGVIPVAAKKIVAPPPPAPAPPPVAQAVADGDPYPMRFRRITASNGRFESYTLRPGAPVRKGALVSSGTWTTVAKETPFSAFGRIPKADLPSAEQKWGDVLLGVWYSVNGDHIGYVKTFDVK